MKAAMDLARDALKAKFVEEDARAKQELERRRKVEPVFLVDPLAPPRLLDEGLFIYLLPPRDDEGLELAVARLQELGFEFSMSDNVKTYKLERADYVVYADPRSAKSIEFLVCKRPLAGRGRHQRRSSFTIPDRWKKDLKNKFETYINAAIGNL